MDLYHINVGISGAVLFGSTSYIMQTTLRGKTAPKTGVFTLVGGVKLGPCDLVGYILTL